MQELWHGDCLELMKNIPDNSVDLIITSPPYFIGKEYEKGVDIDYTEFTEKYLTECYRILKSGRNMMLQVGCRIENGNNIPIPYTIWPVIQKVGFNLRQEIVWHTYGGLQAKTKLTGQNEKILWLYKGDDRPYFDLDAIRIKEWKRIDKRNNPNGKNPTDVWQINRVTYTKKRLPHPCQFPEKLVERCILGWSKPGELVFEPFCGSGTTPFVAKQLDRKFIAIEKDPIYYAIAKERVFGER